jgi:uncharacterized protein (DUF1015 family)
MDYLEKRCMSDCLMALSYVAVTTEEIRAVADDHLIMPPKSSCFLPKPRSGAVVRLLE